MTHTQTNPYRDSVENRRAAFATRRGTPNSVLDARAAAAKKLGIGYYSPEQIAQRARFAQQWDESERRHAEAERELERIFSTPGAITWIVGTNHDVPIAAYLNGVENVKLCTRVDCCNGVLETDEQKAERLARLEDGCGVGRSAEPELRPFWLTDEDPHYLGVVTGLS